MVTGDSFKLPCSHCYHLVCLRKWYDIQTKCPLCMFDLTQVLSKEKIMEVLIQEGIDTPELQEIAELMEENKHQEEEEQSSNKEQLQKIIDEIEMYENEILRIKNEIKRREQEQTSE